MIEAKYVGVEKLNYLQADLSELKYIKIIYSDIDGTTHELKTETNFLSDTYLSLFVKRKKENPKNLYDDDETSSENDEMAESSNKVFDDYLKKLAEIRAAKEMIGERGEEEEYRKRLEELKQEEELKKTQEKEAEETTETEEDEENETKQYEVDCPQEILLKFVIGELLYIAKTELSEVQIKPSKVYFRIKAPEVLTLEQHRKFYRIDLKRLCILVAKNKEGSATVYLAKSINLSAGGVLINRLESITDSKFVKIDNEDYEKYNLVIVLEPEKILKLSARYIREEQGKKCWRYAFEFNDISEDKVNYISKYVIGKQIEEIRAEYDMKNKNFHIKPPKRNK